MKINNLGVAAAGVIDLDAAFPAFLVYMINKLKVFPSVCFSWVAVPSLQRISLCLFVYFCFVFPKRPVFLG